MWSEFEKIYKQLQDEESRFIFLKRLQYSLSNQDKESMYSIAIRKPDDGEHSLYTLLKERNRYSKEQPVIIFGAGFRGKIYKPFIEGYTVGTLIAYCDNKKELQGTIIEGIPVLSVEDACSQEPTALFILLGEKASEEMKEQLIGLGIEEERIFSYPSKEKIYGVQYFDMNIIRRPSGGEVFVDGGCFDLKNTCHFMNIYSEFKKVYAFEPDTLNYKKCIDAKKVYLDDDNRVEFINKGLWSRDEKLSFSGGEGTSSHLSEYGKTTIEATSIDNFFDGRGEGKVSFIKMDIEGAELEALKGARNTILKDKPDLAICVYHKNEDIIEIPRYILELDPEYELYLRHYDLAEYETVLYAVRPRVTSFQLADFKWKILTKILDESDKVISTISRKCNPVIYGMGNLTYALVKEMRARNILPLCIIDSYKESGNFEGIPVYNIKEVKELETKKISVIVTPINGVSEIYKKLEENGIRGEIIPVWDIINDSEIADRLKYINKL